MKKSVYTLEATPPMLARKGVYFLCFLFLTIIGVLLMYKTPEQVPVRLLAVHEPTTWNCEANEKAYAKVQMLQGKTISVKSPQSGKTYTGRIETVSGNERQFSIRFEQPADSEKATANLLLSSDAYRVNLVKKLFKF
jgi:ribosomal protein L35AE/L33A